MKNLFSSTVQAVRNAISNAMTLALTNPSLPEPRLVANMVKNIPLEINNISMPGFSVSAGGVFVHQSPNVKWNIPHMHKNYVEIGDLLLLRKEGTREPFRYRRAMLLQAKKIKPSWNNIPDNPDQHTLYHQWPRFEYTRLTALKGQFRHITRQDIYMGTKFLLLSDTQSCSGCINRFNCVTAPGCLTALPTKPQVNGYRCFADELTHFILGLAGKPYNILSSASQQTGWSKVIEDLTTITAQRIAKVAGNSFARGHGVSDFLSGDVKALTCMQGIDVSNIMRFDENNRNDDIEWNNNEHGNDDPGFSIIEFTISENEQQIENNQRNTINC
ncbi:MAG: hypothetical protein LBR84_02130 [Tannerella sp.]|nr:hypothetical protein [Tannerella sp.]